MDSRYRIPPLVDIVIKIKLGGRLKDIIGSDELVIDKPVKTVRELIEALKEKYPQLRGRLEELFPSGTDTGTPMSTLVILVNGHPITFTGGLDTPLYSGDEVKIDEIVITQLVGGG